MQRYRTAYRRFQKSPLEWMDPNMEFKPTDYRVAFSSLARSSANNPLKLRRGFINHQVGMPLPDTLVIRNSATGDIYLCGESRQDSEAGRAYVGTTETHKVTPSGHLGSSGVASVIRKAPAGPVDDPGWIEPLPELLMYADLVRTGNKQARGAYRWDEAMFDLYTSRAHELQRYDVVMLNGYTVRVGDVYPDGGFMAAYCLEGGDNRVNLVLIHQGTPYQDPETLEWTEGGRRYNITGAFSSGELTDQDNASGNEFVLIVDQNHIGVTPTPNDRVEYDGHQWEISSVQFDSDLRQYKLSLT